MQHVLLLGHRRWRPQAAAAHSADPRFYHAGAVSILKVSVSTAWRTTVHRTPTDTRICNPFGPYGPCYGPHTFSPPWYGSHGGSVPKAAALRQPHQALLRRPFSKWLNALASANVPASTYQRWHLCALAHVHLHIFEANIFLLSQTLIPSQNQWLP